MREREALGVRRPGHLHVRERVEQAGERADRSRGDPAGPVPTEREPEEPYCFAPE